MICPWAFNYDFMNAAALETAIGKGSTGDLGTTGNYIDPMKLPKPIFDLDRIDADVALMHQVLHEEDVGNSQQRMALDAYRDELAYTIQQLGGDARAYQLFLGSPFRERGLPSREIEPRSATIFTIFDLPVLRQLRAMYPRPRRSYMAIEIANFGGKLVQLGLRAASQHTLRQEVKKPSDLIKVLVATAAERVSNVLDGVGVLDE